MEVADHRRQLADFVEAIRQDRLPKVDGREGKRAVDLVCAIYESNRTGRVVEIDNRRLARVAKLAGAPHDPAAGLVLHHPLGSLVEAGEPLFTVHAEAPGMLAYALAYVAGTARIIRVEPA